MKRPAPPAIPGGVLRAAQWLGILLVVAGLLWPLAAPAQVQRIHSALAAEGAGSAPPPRAAYRQVTLPDDWAASRPDASGPVWYRVEFPASEAPAADELLALYVEHVCTTFVVHLNGRLIHRGGRTSEPLTQQCGHPQLVTLPAVLVRPGEANVLDIAVFGHALAQVGSRRRAGALSALAIGPQSQLAAREARHATTRIAVPQALGATLLLMGGFMFVLGFVNRRESHLAYFGALSVGWALLDARLWLRELPVSHGVAEFLMCSLMAFLTLAGVQFLLREVQWRHKAVDLALPLQCAVMPATLLLAGPARLYPVASAWYAVLALELVVAGAFHLLRLWQARSPSFWPMAVLMAAVAAAGTVEFAGQRVGTQSVVVQLAQLALPAVLVVVGLRLMEQHGRALLDAESGKAQLESRIRDATAEIERNFRQLSELKIEQVTERERKRIAADLHDDLGAKLLTIVHTSDSERISTLAREALEEMRLSVRGLTGRPVRLSDALGDWRAEVVSRLAQAGVQADWSAPEDLHQTLSARAYVQTTRILREATSNIIKHSGASHCSVQCQVADGDFQFVVQDNGEGIPVEVEGRLDRGHGMATMKQRAKQMNGQCLVESGPGYGTVIRLTLPLDSALEGT